MNLDKNLLEFYRENNCLDAVGEEPINRYVAQVATVIAPTPIPQPTKTPAVVVAPISDQLQNCKTLDELKAALQAFEGCELKRTAQNTVFADGNPNSPVMLVGEAPGADEDAQGLPFVGQSGQLLNNIIASIGLDRTNAYISNIIPWRPPGNRPPTTQEIAICLPFIQKHIAIVKPRVLVFVGGVSAKSLLNSSEGIMKLRGQWFDYKTLHGDTVKALATFHPAYLLRSPGQKALVWQDMLMIQEYLNNVPG